MQAYPKYKDSGVLWFGEIPEHWSIKPGLAIYVEKQIKNTLLIEKQVLSLSYGKIIIKSTEKLKGLVPESFETYQIVEPGDIIIRSTDMQNDHTSLRTGIVNHKGIITSAYICLKSLVPLSSSFNHWQLHGFDLMKLFYGLGSGLRQNLSWNDFKRLSFPVPLIDEQQKISQYLDWKTSKITKFIKAKKKLILLLKERKQNIINQAVIKGINPNVKMKDSGVEWLGEIPEHWKLHRGKYYFKELDLRSETGNEELLSVSHLTGITPRSQKSINMFLAENYIGSKICKPGFLAVNTMWAWMAAIGVSKYEGVISPSYHTYVQKKQTYDEVFLDILLRCSPMKDAYTVNSSGITNSRMRLYPDKFLRIFFVCPPIKEQQLIVKYIKTETTVIEQTISRAEREIELIQEYRNRLISDVVTGKVDVRSIDIPNYDTVEPEMDNIEDDEVEDEVNTEESEP